MTSTQSTTGSWLTDSIARNPEGLLLLGAGLALLMRKAVVTRPSQLSQTERSDRSGPGRHTRDNNRSSNLTEKMKEAVGSVGEYASDISEKAADAVSGYASSAADYATQASERTRDVAQQAGSTLQSSAQTILRDQPLAVALAGLAVGVAVAAAFPSTDIERRNLGLTGARLKDAATKASEQIKGAGVQAKEKLASVAEERGLTGEGLKGMAKEVTEAFSDALSDEQGATSSQGGGMGRKSETLAGRSGSQLGGSGVQNDPFAKRGS